MDGAPHPEDHESDAVGAAGAGQDGEFTRSEALRTAAFWIVTFSMGSQALVGTGLTFHIVDIGAEAGLSEAAAVAIFLPIALVTVPVGFLAGAAIDRYPIRYLIVVTMIAECFMFVGMAHQDQPIMRVAAIAGWGVASGFFGPLMTAAMPNYFGRLHLGAIQGGPDDGPGHRQRPGPVGTGAVQGPDGLLPAGPLRADGAPGGGGPGCAVRADSKASRSKRLNRA